MTVAAERPDGGPIYRCEMASHLELGELIEQIADVLDAQPVAFAYLFGSHARGDAGADSDVDVAVHFVDGIDRVSRFERCLEIGAELERRLRRAVDVVDLQESPIRLAGRVITERVIVVGMRSEERVRYETELFGPYSISSTTPAISTSSCSKPPPGATADGGRLMGDAPRLDALLEQLRVAEGDLRRLRGLGREPVREDVDLTNSVKYLFILAAEVAIDVGQHLISSRGLRPAETFAGVFAELGDAELIAADLADSLATMARFRNLLVHGYATVDDDIVLATLHSHRIDDLARFRQQVSALSR